LTPKKVVSLRNTVRTIERIFPISDLDVDVKVEKLEDVVGGDGECRDTNVCVCVAGCSSLSCAGGSCIDRNDICDGCSNGYSMSPDEKHCGSKYPSSMLASLFAK